LIALNEPKRRCARFRESPALSATSSSTRLAVLSRLSETLVTAAIGGSALGLIGVPAGWLSGSILAVAGSAIAGRPMLIPTLLMRAIFVLIGTSLGAVVTPETLHGMATYPLSIAVLILAMAVVSVGGAGYLRLVHRWGTVDSYLAAAPGGMSQVLALGAELGADLRAIAIVQSIRVVVIAVGLPAGLSLLGLVGHAAPRMSGPLSIDMLDELAILLAASTVVAIVANRIPVPIRTTPATSEAPTVSPSVSVEMRMPRLGVASSAIDIVLARRCRPVSTTAQYANAVATGPT